MYKNLGQFNNTTVIIKEDRNNWITAIQFQTTNNTITRHGNFPLKEADIMNNIHDLILYIENCQYSLSHKIKIIDSVLYNEYIGKFNIKLFAKNYYKALEEKIRTEKRIATEEKLTIEKNELLGKIKPSKKYRFVIGAEKYLILTNDNVKEFDNSIDLQENIDSLKKILEYIKAV